MIRRGDLHSRRGLFVNNTVVRDLAFIAKRKNLGNRIVKGDKVRLYGKNDEIYYDKIY